MICPECKQEIPAGISNCPQCGAVLTQPEPTASTLHRTNQVWDSEIELEKNRANSRTAMIALAAAIAMILGLVACLWFSLPAMGDALIGEREPRQSFTERMDEFFAFVADSFGGSPEPAPEPAATLVPDIQIHGSADDEFVAMVAEYLTVDYYNDDNGRLLLPEMYVSTFEFFLTADYADEDMVTRVIQIVGALRSMRDSIDPDSLTIIDSALWLSGRTTLCQVATELHVYYGLTCEDSEIPVYYEEMLFIYRAWLAVEQDLTWQLIDTQEPIWNDALACYTLNYTNCTDYALDISFYSEYATEDGIFGEAQYFNISPNERITIELRKMPVEYDEWNFHWTIDRCSLNGTDIPAVLY